MTDPARMTEATCEGKPARAGELDATNGADRSRASGLEVNGIAVEVNGQPVLSDVRVAVRPGEAVGIVGETGSGKTMTSRVVTGTLDRIGGEVTAGEAMFDGLDLTALGEREWRSLRGHRIALVPQSSQSGLDPLRTVGQHLVETVEVLTGCEDAESRARELLESVSLEPSERLLRAHSHELSGGMRQRVMIALALAADAELLIGDEPTTALDVTVQREILDLLSELRRERGLSLVLITHDLAVVEEVTDTVSIMYAGMTVETGPTKEVMSRPRHPYTAALLGARPGNASRERPLVNIPGAPPFSSSWPEGCRFAPRCKFATDACRADLPALRELGPGHRAACVRAEEVEL